MPLAARPNPTFTGISQPRRRHLGSVPRSARGSVASNEMTMMVAGDDALRRPYLVALANPNRVAGARVEAARKLARFLRSEETQKWIAQFGKGKYDARPLFFPVEIDPSI